LLHFNLTSVSFKLLELNYSNSILYGTSLSSLHKLQMVQNALVRTVTKSLKLVPVSQLLSNLPWLPINKRISFIIAALTYKVLSTQQPSFSSVQFPTNTVYEIPTHLSSAHTSYLSLFLILVR